MTTRHVSRTGFNLSPALLLRLEAAALFVGAVAVYATQGGNWLLFVVLLLAPDLSMLGYLVNQRFGAAVYNLAHTTITPLLLLAAGLATGALMLVQVALIFLAHIGMDRFVGYGLKYTTAFKDTHLQRL